MKATVLTWDWKGQPDMNLVGAAIKAVFNGHVCPGVMEVQNTRSDQGAIVVSEGPISVENAQEVWDCYSTSEADLDIEDPLERVRDYQISARGHG